MVIESVGLDFGKTALKAVKFRRALSGRESIDYFYQSIPTGFHDTADPERKAGLLRNFLWKNDLYGKPVVTALPCEDLFIRTLSLPFHNLKTLTEIIPHEVENLIPMSLDDVTIGSTVLSRSASRDRHQAGTSDVLVTAVPKQRVTDHLKLLASADLDPSAVNIDGLALFSVSEFLKRACRSMPGDLSIIDIGASKTILCLIQDGLPRMVRTIPWGGQDLTQALAVRESCSWQEAERMKRTMEAKELELWLEPLIRDIRLTLHQFESETKARIRHCWVSGGGAKLRDLPLLLPCRFGLTPAGPRQGFDTDAPKAFAIALGLSTHPKLVGPRWRDRRQASAPAADLRRAPETTAQQATATRRDKKLVVAGIVLLCLAAIGDLFVWVAEGERRVNGLKEAVHEEFLRHFGSGEFAGDEVEQARIRLGTVKKQLDVLTVRQDRILPLLSSLATEVPATIMFKIRELTAEGGAVHLEAETDSFDAIERVKTSLANAPGFDSVAVSDSHLGAEPNRIIFRLTIGGPQP
ncbi:MAG: pilus assembly protein PilM [Nitrospira sp.]|jgi:general secretion pathway protein L|nr:pilus assembly protein PilM [Nitrospira sp.]